MFLAFAPRPRLSMSEIRPEDPLKNLPENVCHSLRDRILRFGGCFGSMQGGTTCGRDNVLQQQ